MATRRSILGSLSTVLLLSALVVSVVSFVWSTSDNTSDHESHIGISMDAATVAIRSLVIAVIGVIIALPLALLALIRGEDRLFPLTTLFFSLLVTALIIVSFAT